jgi:hypothetical protein
VDAVTTATRVAVADRFVEFINRFAKPGLCEPPSPIAETAAIVEMIAARPAVDPAARRVVDPLTHVDATMVAMAAIPAAIPAEAGGAGIVDLALGCLPCSHLNAGAADVGAANDIGVISTAIHLNAGILATAEETIPVENATPAEAMFNEVAQNAAERTTRMDTPKAIQRDDMPSAVET